MAAGSAQAVVAVGSAQAMVVVGSAQVVAAGLAPLLPRPRLQAVAAVVAADIEGNNVLPFLHPFLS